MAQHYYLFLCSQKPIEVDFLYQAADLIEELDSKQRKIRFLRGYLLYALKIMEKGKNFKILSTNFRPFFWKKVQNVIRQNKREVLQEFIFGSALPSDSEIQNPLNSLQEKRIDLESKV